MEALIIEKATVRLRKIDIDTWDSPIAKAHRIRRLPTLQLYAGRELVSADTSAVLALLQQR